VTVNRREIRARLRELEDMKVLLEEARGHARSIGGTDSERIEAEIKTTLREVNKLAADLRAFLP
jgi:hypothetical protein